MFDGEFYEEGDPDYPWEVDDYVLQFAEDRWRDSKGIARVLNHSCQPNIGIRNAFRLIAMRDIAPDEELCYDYAMAEDGQWQLDCQCGSPNCRGRMAGFAALPESVRESYQGVHFPLARRKVPTRFYLERGDLLTFKLIKHIRMGEVSQCTRITAAGFRCKAEFLILQNDEGGQ